MRMEEVDVSERTYFTPVDVFISWNNQDRAWKDEVVGFLKEQGFSVWESDYECSGSIKESCLGQIPVCKVFLILLTPNSLQSFWVKDELDTHH